MLKKLIILSGSILLFIIIIELALGLYNPFSSEQTHIPDFDQLPPMRLEVRPEAITQKRTIYVLNSILPNKVQNQNLWLDAFLESQKHTTTLYRLYDLSTPLNYMQDPSGLKNLLSTQPPDILILHIHPNLLNNILSVPEFDFYEPDLRFPVFDKEPQLLKSVQYFSKRQAVESDSFYLDFTVGLKGFRTTPPPPPTQLFKYVKSKSKRHAQTITSLASLSQKLGFQIFIAPYPILWDSKKTDRYTSMPLSPIVVHNNIPGLWYHEIYQLYVSALYEALGNDLNWIDAYRFFPKDSRFFSDGFRLNKEGHEFYCKMVQGRMEAGKIASF